jgi:hypothetical protein
VSEQAVQPDGPTITARTSSAQLRMLRSDATRYLCAGTYLDSEFRDAALQELLGQKNRAVAPSYSTDVVPVVRHALNARRRQVVRDAVLTGVVVLLLLLQGRNLLAFAAIGVAVLLAVRAVRALVGLRFGTALALLPPIVIALLVSALLLESNANLFASLTGSSSYDPLPSVQSFAGWSLFVFAVLLGGAWAAVVVERLANRQAILDQLTTEKFTPDHSPPEPPAHRARLRYIADAQTGNVTYYRSTAADRPFVGAGETGAPWTPAVPLVQSDQETGRAPMTTETLQDAISLALARLNASDSESDGPENEISVQSRLVTPGTLKRDDLLLDSVTGLPRPRITHAEMHQLAEAETTGTHQYLSVRMAPRRGSYEIWVFLRCQVEAKTLYLELISSFVPPIRAAYREIDHYSELDNTVIVRTAVGALLELPQLLIRAPLRLLRIAIGSNPQSQDVSSRLRHLVAASPTDYGAHAGVRELAVEEQAEDYLSKLAVQRQIHLIERNIVETVAASMEQAGFATDEFRTRAQTIHDGSVR